MAPRQASGAAVALAEAEGHLHMSPQYQQLHPHPYPPAQHRSRASAHPDSPVDEVWKDYFAVLNFGFLKRIQTPHSLLNFILGFRSR